MESPMRASNAGEQSGRRTEGARSSGAIAASSGRARAPDRGGGPRASPTDPIPIPSVSHPYSGMKALCMVYDVGGVWCMVVMI